MNCSRRFTLPTLMAASLLMAGGCAMDGDATGSTEEMLRIATPTAQDLSEDARVAIVDAVRDRTDVTTGPWTLVSLRWEETWALATLTSADLEQPLGEHEESHLTFENLYALLLVQTEVGWEAALEDDARIHDLLEGVPESELSATARSAMFPRKGEIRDSVYSGYKFFWPAGHPWRVTQGWHDGYTWGGRFPAYTSLDLDINDSTNSDILAGAPGTVSYMCDDGVQVLVGITTEGTSEMLGYLHLDRASVVNQGITNGTVVSMGTKLGRMLNSDGGTIQTSCGTSMGTHIHMYLPYKPITIDGVTFSDSNVHWGEDLYSSQGSSGSTEVVVDDQSSGFTRYGPSSYWWQAWIGYASHMWYTYVNGYTKSNYARWKPSLSSSGYYTVYAFIPYDNATSQQAKYRIYHNGSNSYATVNQSIYYDQWVSLGTHYFSANGSEYVELSDATGESGSTYRKIGFDAVKFVK